MSHGLAHAPALSSARRFSSTGALSLSFVFSLSLSVPLPVASSKGERREAERVGGIDGQGREGKIESESRTKARVILRRARSLPLAAHSTRPVALSPSLPLPLSLLAATQPRSQPLPLPLFCPAGVTFQIFLRSVAGTSTTGAPKTNVRPRSPVSTRDERTNSRRGNGSTLSPSVFRLPVFRTVDWLSPRAFAPFPHCFPVSSHRACTYTPVTPLSVLPDTSPERTTPDKTRVHGVKGPKKRPSLLPHRSRIILSRASIEKFT